MTAGGAIAGGMPPSPAAPAADAVAGRRSDLVLIVAAVVAAGLVLSLRAPARSEVRYLEACREMLETGDWVVPRLAYVPYFEKPVLLYWLGAAAQALFGGSDVAGRLPTVLAAALGVAVSYAFGASLGGRRLGLIAAGVLGASAGWLLFASVFTMDILLAGLLWLAWWCWWRHDRGGRGWIWGFWSALGLAVLTKGPIAIVLTGGGIGLYLLAMNRLRVAGRSRLVLGPLLVLAINLPWTLLAWRRDPRFIEFFYVRENLKAFVDPTINHRGPLWLYPAVIVVFLMPWTLPALAGAGASFAAAARAAAARWRAPAPPARDDLGDACAFLAALTAFGLLFLTASASKLESYVVPLLPPIALLAAIALARGPAWLRPLAAIQTGFGAVVGLAALVVLPLLPRLLRPGALERLDLTWWPVVWAGLALLAAGGVAGWTVALRRGAERADDPARRPLIALGLGAAGLAGALLVIGPIALEVRRDATAARLSRLVAERAGADDRVIVGTSAVHDYTIVRALKRRLYYQDYVREIGMGHFTEVTPPSVPIPDEPYEVSGANLPQNPWLLDPQRLADAWRAGPCWLFAASDEAEPLRARGLEVVLVGTAGGVALLRNPQAAARGAGAE